MKAVLQRGLAGITLDTKYVNRYKQAQELFETIFLILYFGFTHEVKKRATTKVDTIILSVLGKSNGFRKLLLITRHDMKASRVVITAIHGMLLQLLIPTTIHANQERQEELKKEIRVMFTSYKQGNPINENQLNKFKEELQNITSLILAGVEYDIVGDINLKELVKATNTICRHILTTAGATLRLLRSVGIRDDESTNLHNFMASFTVDRSATVSRADKELNQVTPKYRNVIIIWDLSEELLCEYDYGYPAMMYSPMYKLFLLRLFALAKENVTIITTDGAIDYVTQKERTVDNMMQVFDRCGIDSICTTEDLWYRRRQTYLTNTCIEDAVKNISDEDVIIFVKVYQEDDGIDKLHSSLRNQYTKLRKRGVNCKRVTVHIGYETGGEYSREIDTLNAAIGEVSG